jgi:hypothetical protein
MLKEKKMKDDFKKIYSILKKRTINEKPILDWIELLANESGATVHRNTKEGEIS